MARRFYRRVLDEVAAAIRNARGRLPQSIVPEFGLEEQFGRPLAPAEWNAIQRHLACPLTPLEFVQGHWFLPEGFTTIWDLAARAGRAHPEWVRPLERPEAAWREAQVFIGVRACLADAGGLELHDVVRQARLKGDLGLE